MLVDEALRACIDTGARKWVGDRLGKGYDGVTGAVGDAGSWVGDEAPSARDWAFG